jgi:hypothetical protein
MNSELQNFYPYNNLIEIHVLQSLMFWTISFSWTSKTVAGLLRTSTLCASLFAVQIIVYKSKMTEE